MATMDSSSSMKSTRPFIGATASPGRFHRTPVRSRAKRRQPEMEGRAMPEFRLHLNVALVLADDRIDRGQPQSAAVLLGGEVRIENPAEVLRS